MKIGIKYCGGCNPRYDRTNVIEQLKKDLPGSDAFLAEPFADMDYVVVVCGCKSACALIDGFEGRYGRTILTESDAYDGLLSELKQIQLKIKGENLT